MKDHGLWMTIGCVLPMLLIFILPAFGFSSQTVFVIGIISMLACHLLMLGYHRGADGQDEKRRH
jgi:hypothetical protein